MLNYREVDIDQLHDEDVFQAWGYATLKVQRGDEVIGVKIRVASVPQELIEGLRRRAPRPPAKTVMLDPNTDEGRALGVTTRQKATIPDFSDPDYRERQDAYDLSFRQEVVGHGVASKLTLKDGRLAQTPEEKYKALEERGLSGVHFVEIAETILRLTQWTEEERANFSMRASASKAGK